MCDCAAKAAKARAAEEEAEFQRLMKLSDEELIAVCKARGVKIESK